MYRLVTRPSDEPNALSVDEISVPTASGARNQTVDVFEHQISDRAIVVVSLPQESCDGPPQQALPASEPL